MISSRSCGHRIASYLCPGNDMMCVQMPAEYFQSMLNIVEQSVGGVRVSQSSAVIQHR